MWRKNNLPIETFFKEHGMSSSNHKSTNAGCQGARSDLITGVSYRKHKVTLTEGLSQNVNFVDPEKTPTL